MEALDEFIAACEAGASLHERVLDARSPRLGPARGATRPVPSQIIERAVELARVQGDPRELASSLRSAPTTHADRGELERARALADEAILIIRETGHARGASGG